VNVRLVDLPLPVLVALRDGEIDTASSQLGLDIPADFAANVDIWTFMSGLRSDPANEGWTMNAIVRDDVIVGNAGFKGAPSHRGEVEMGYLVLEAHRRQGLAVTAARLLLDRVTLDPSVSRVIATIAPENAASIAVITSAGFSDAGDRIHERWGRQLVFSRDVTESAVRH
jgi:ribosomal-protein-alanine N-acetyltransferase